MASGTDQIRRRATEISRLFFEQNLSKSEISRKKGISVTHVNRILREAGKLGVLKVTVNVPRVQMLEEKLRDSLQLRHVTVIQASEERDTTQKELAVAAAAAFDTLVKSGAAVGVSSGRTMFEMAAGLSEKPRQIKIYPLNVVAENTIELRGPSANTVASAMWFRSRPDCRAVHVELFSPADEVATAERAIRLILESPDVKNAQSELDRLDAYFLTTSLIRPDSSLYRLWSQRGVTERELQTRRIVGDIAFNVMDENGRAVPSGLEHLMFQVQLSTLRQSAADPQKVVAMVGGVGKVGAIRAAARGRLFNTLITDSDTAEFLLDQKVPDLQQPRSRIF